jgi:hypothetical protein
MLTPILTLTYASKPPGLTLVVVVVECQLFWSIYGASLVFETQEQAEAFQLRALHAAPLGPAPHAPPAASIPTLLCLRGRVNRLRPDGSYDLQESVPCPPLVGLTDGG